MMPALLRSFIQRRTGSELTVANADGKTAQYLSHLVFFRSFGVNVGNAPGEAPGSDNYIPITYLSVEELLSEAKAGGNYVGEVLEDHCRQFACILTRQDDGDLVDTLQFSLREIMRNVVEHSGADSIWFSAQYWPTRHRIELAIVDEGIGIANSLRDNPHLPREMNNYATLHYAMLPGISSKAYAGRKPRRRDGWENSGFGLFMTSEISRRTGSFLIASGDFALKLKGTSKVTYPAGFGGTAVAFSLSTKAMDDTGSLLAQCRELGYKLAKKVEGANLTPSQASTMLMR